MLNSVGGLTQKRYKLNHLWILSRCHMDYISFGSFQLVLWHRADTVVSFCVLSSILLSRFLEVNLMRSGQLLQWRLSLKLIISSWYASVLLLIVFAWCCKQWIILFFTLYGWWGLKLRYCLVKVGLQYTDDLNPCSVRVTNTSRKGNLLSCSFSIVNCIDDRIEFMWSSNVWTSSWWDQRMNVSSM